MAYATNLDALLDDDTVTYWAAITYTAWKFTDESGEYDDDHGYECEGDEYTARELYDLLDRDGYIHPSNSGPHGPNVSTWISTEAREDYRTGWNRYTSLHIRSDGARAGILWGLLLEKFDIARCGAAVAA